MAKTKSKTVPAGNGTANNTIDIPHEEIKDYDAKVEKALLKRDLTPEQTAQQEIKKFNLADSAIEALNDKYGDLVISGPEDKEGYKQVREAWQEVRTIRTGLEKKGKELRDGYNLISKKIIKEEDRLIDLISPLEYKLHSAWKAIDEEKERAQREKEEAEERQFVSRLQELSRLGLVLEGGFYSIGEGINFDAVTLRSMPDERFEALRAKAEGIFQEEQRKAAAAAEERRKEAEAYELAKKQLEEQRAQMERDRQEFEKAKQEAQKQILENRVNKFLALGMVKGGGDLHFDTEFSKITVMGDQLLGYSNEAFNEFLGEITEEIKKAKDLQAERHAERENQAKEKEARERFISVQLEAAGLRYNYVKKQFEFISGLGPGYDIVTTFVDFEGKTEEEISNDAKQCQMLIDEAKELLYEQQQEKQAEAERERQAGMKDADRVEEIIEKLRVVAKSIVADSFKTEKYRQRAYNIFDALQGIILTHSK